MRTIVTTIPKTAQAKKPQSTKLLAKAGTTAAAVPDSTSLKNGGVSIKCDRGSAAAQKPPPAASKVHIMTDTHSNVPISGFSFFPNLILPYLEKPKYSAMKKVPSRMTW